MSQTVLFALINPTLKVPVSINEFSESVEYIQANYMYVKSQSFPLGSTSVQFQVVFGNVTEKEGAIVNFRAEKSQNVILSGAPIEDWGTDDSEILYAIASTLGTNIVQITEVVIEEPILFFN